MTEFLSSTTLLAVAAGLLGLGFVVGLVVLALPAPPKLPLDRRRPGVAPGPTPLELAANATTSSIERLIRGRGGNASTLLERAGVRRPLKDVVVLVGSGMIAAFALGLLFGGLLLAAIGALIVPLLARLWLGGMVSRREKAFGDQLDETLQILSGSLRAGYSLPQAVSTVAQEAEAPTGEEFARIINETRVGRELGDAMADAAVRTRNEDFFWVTQAITINREVGGDLADVLDGVGHTIRQRSQLRRQVRALSAEGRLSAIILGALPFFLFGLLWFTNRDYVMTLFTSTLGWVMVAVGAVLLLVGILWLRKTVQIKF